MIWLRGRELRLHCQRESEKVHDYSGASFSLCSKHVLMADRSVASSMQQPLLVEQSFRRESSGLRNQYQRTDFASNLNTILKMAKKRSYVDAILTACHGSGVFTQDVEDIANNVQSRSDVKEV